MLKYFTCLHCGKTMQRNPCSKNQQYCSSRACQNTRRIASNKAKAKKSKESRLLRKARNKRWRDKHHAHKYQNRYRQERPDYEERNREQQKERNKKREKEQPSMIVKTYALSPQPLQDGAYMGFEVKNGKIVKTYAYTAQMQAQSAIDTHLPQKPG